MKMLHITTCILSILLIYNCSSRKNNDNPAVIKYNGHAVTLTKIYWKLTELNGKPVSGYAAQNKEPFLMLKKEGNRAEGTGGCNGMGGTYKLYEKDKIDFSQLISTKMACGDMVLETEFHKALEMTASYQSNGKELKLFDENGVLLARFEASTRK